MQCLLKILSLNLVLEGFPSWYRKEGAKDVTKLFKTSYLYSFIVGLMNPFLVPFIYFYFGYFLKAAFVVNYTAVLFG